MAPLFDMFAQAQNGNAIELMAKQFGLAQEQMAKATAALMPAFSTGFKHNTANPYDFGALLTALSTGNYARYFEDMRQAFTPQGVADGNGVLGQLFGSKEMSRAIAAQAEQMTGIGQEIYKQMLPVMASTLMGGLFKQTTGQMSGGLADNPMMTLMRQWMEATGLAKKAEPQPNPFDNPFTQAMQGFFGIGKGGNGQGRRNGQSGREECGRHVRRQSVLQGLSGDDEQRRQRAESVGRQPGICPIFAGDEQPVR